MNDLKDMSGFPNGQALFFLAFETIRKTLYNSLNLPCRRLVIASLCPQPLKVN
jgi:hypothetical protein